MIFPLGKIPYKGEKMSYIDSLSDDEIEKLWKELLPKVEKLSKIPTEISKEAKPGFIDKEE